MTLSTLRSAVAFGANLLLARLLTPTDFGLFYVALGVVGLGTLLVDFGLGASIIQRRDTPWVEIRALFSWQLLAGLVLSAGTALAARPLAAAFGQEQAAPFVALLGAAIVVSAAGQTAAAVLRREFRFAHWQGATTIAYFGGFLGVALPLAYAGFGVWSLVWGQMANVILQSTFYMLLSHVTPTVSLAPALKHVRFGLKVQSVAIINWLRTYTAGIVVSRAFGVVELGYFDRAHYLTSSTTSIVAGPLRSVFFVEFSRIKEDLPRVAALIGVAVSRILPVVSPLFVAAAVNAPLILVTLYGEPWSPAASMLRPLLMTVPFEVLAVYASSALWGMGLPEREAAIGLRLLLVGLPLLIAAAFVSAAAVAWSILLLSILRAGWLAAAALMVAGAGRVWIVLGAARLTVGAAIAVGVTMLLGGVHDPSSTSIVRGAATVVLASVLGSLMVVLLLVLSEGWPLSRAHTKSFLPQRRRP